MRRTAAWSAHAQDQAPPPDADVYFAGFQENPYRFLSRARLFALTSLWEGFPNALVEAMASGVPVVASYSSSLPEVVGDAGLLVDPYNINDIAQALKEILTDENLKNKLVERGLKRAKNFSWQNTAKESLKMFNHE